MTVINSKKGAFRPYLVLSMLWLHNVQNNTDSILIIVSYKTLICIGCIRADNSIALETAFGWLVVRYNDPRTRLQCGRLLQGSWIFVDHLICVQNS